MTFSIFISLCILGITQGALIRGRGRIRDGGLLRRNHGVATDVVRRPLSYNRLNRITLPRIGPVTAIDPDMIISKNPDPDRSSAAFLGDILCQWCQLTNNAICIAQHCSSASGTQSKTTNSSQDNLPKLKCDFCKVFNEAKCISDYCALTSVALLSRSDKPIDNRSLIKDASAIA